MPQFTGFLNGVAIFQKDGIQRSLGLEGMEPVELMLKSDLEEARGNDDSGMSALIAACTTARHAEFRLTSAAPSWSFIQIALNTVLTDADQNILSSKYGVPTGDDGNDSTIDLPVTPVAGSVRVSYLDANPGEETITGFSVAGNTVTLTGTGIISDRLVVSYFEAPQVGQKQLVWGGREDAKIGYFGVGGIFTGCGDEMKVQALRCASGTDANFKAVGAGNSSSTNAIIKPTRDQFGNLLRATVLEAA